MTTTALIGLGHWGQNVARELDLASEFKGYSDDLNKNLNAPYSYLTTEQIMHDTSIQALWIATPVESHLNLALAALAAGKHVMVEKPLAKPSEDMSEFISLSIASKKIVGVGYIYLYDNAFQKLCSEMAAHPPHIILAKWKKYGSFRDAIELNLLSHHIAMSMAMCGKPCSIAYTEPMQYVSNDKLSVSIHFESCQFLSQVDRLSSEREHTMQITCHDGTQYMWEVGKLSVRDKDGAWTNLYSADSNILRSEVKSFITSIENKAPLRYDARFGAKVTELLRLLPSH